MRLILAGVARELWLAGSGDRLQVAVGLQLAVPMDDALADVEQLAGCVEVGLGELLRAREEVVVIVGLIDEDWVVGWVAEELGEPEVESDPVSEVVCEGL